MANDVRIVITGDPSGGVSAIRAVKSELSGLQSAAQSSGGALKNVLETAAGFAVGTLAIGGLTAGWNAAKDSIIGFNSQMQNLNVSFTTLLGSGDKAKAMLGDLQQFARTTPFEMPQLVSASQRLLAFGFNAKDIIPIMTAVGDATSAMGNVSAESLNRVTLAIGQIGTKGKVQTQELLQLTEAGIPAFQMLADGMGKTTGQIADMVEKGLIPADKGLKILLEGMENRAPGAMQKLSTTWTGATSNIKDSLNQLVGGAFKPFFDTLTAGANKFADFLMTDKVEKFAATVSAMTADLAKGLSAIFSGDQAGAEQWFGRFADAARDAANQVQLALLTMADAAAPAVEPIAEAFASLAANAVQWGANLITSFATGLVEAAGSVLSSVMNDIMSFIAGFFPASPAKRGPFRAVYEMGAEMLNSIFKGMSQADFSALDTVMGAVKDVLSAAFSNGGGPKDGLIPAILGSEAGVAQALQDIHEFGSILDDTMTLLQRHLGDAAGEIAGLITNVAQLGEKQTAIKAIDDELKGWARSLDDVNGRIKAVQREMDGVKRAFELQRRPIEDQITAITRLYDTQIRGIDATIRKLEDQLRAQRALLKPQYDALDAEERSASLGDAQQRLADAQNAATQRRAQLERDVADAQRAVANAQHTAAQPNQDAWSRQQNAQAVADAQYRLQQALDRLNREGHQTDADRLAIARARRDVMDAQLAIDTAQTQADLTTAQNDRAQAERDRTAALDPLQAQLTSLKDAEEARLRALQDQLTPLETERQGYEDMRDAAQQRKQTLEDEAKPLQEAITLVTTRLGHEKDVSEQLQRQLDLLNQQAAAAAGGASAGAHGGAGGVGRPGGGASIGQGLGLNITPPRFTRPSGGISREEQENAQPESMESRLARLRAQVAAEFKKGLTEGLKDGFEDFSKQDAVWAGIGAVVGAKMGGPMGAAAGATFGVAFSKELTKGGLFLGGKTLDLFDLLFGEDPFANDTVFDRIKTQFGKLFRPDKWKDFFGDIGSGIVGGIWDGLKFEWETKSDDIVKLWRNLVKSIKGFLGIESPSKVFKEIGSDIVQGAWDGITDKWDTFTTWFGDRCDDLVQGVKRVLGIESPSKLFKEIGGDIVQGAWDGITDKWDGFIKWLHDRWDDLVKGVKKLLGVESPSTVFADIGRDILRGLLKGVEEIWKDVQKWFENLPDNIVTAVGDVSKTLKSLGTDLLGGFWQGVTALWESASGVRQWFEKLGTKALDAIGDISRTLWNKGQQLIQGLWDGATDVWNRFSTWLGDRLRDAGNGLRQLVPGQGGQPKTWNGVAGGGAPKLDDGAGDGSGAVGKGPLAPSGAGWGGVPGATGPAPGGSGAGALGNNDDFLRWLVGQNDALIRAAGYDPVSLREYARASGWGATSARRKAPNGPSTITTPGGTPLAPVGSTTSTVGEQQYAWEGGDNATENGDNHGKITVQQTVNFMGLLDYIKTVVTDRYGTTTNISAQSDLAIVLQRLNMTIEQLNQLMLNGDGSPRANAASTVDWLGRQALEVKAARNPASANFNPVQTALDRAGWGAYVDPSQIMASLGSAEERARFERALTAAGGNLQQAAALYQQYTMDAITAARTQTTAATTQQTAATQQRTAATAQQAATVVWNDITHTWEQTGAQVGQAAGQVKDGAAELGQHVNDFGQIVNSLGRVISEKPDPSQAGSKAEAAQLENELEKRRKEWEKDHPGQPAPFAGGGVAGGMGGPPNDGVLALYGEEGPEIGELPKGTRIHSNTDSKSFIRRAARALGLPGYADGGVAGAPAARLVPVSPPVLAVTPGRGQDCAKAARERGQALGLAGAALEDYVASECGTDHAGTSWGVLPSVTGASRAGAGPLAATGASGGLVVNVNMQGAQIFGMDDLDKHIVQTVERAFAATY